MTKKRDANEYAGSVFPLEHVERDATFFHDYSPHNMPISIEIIDKQGNRHVLWTPESSYDSLFFSADKDKRESTIAELETLKQQAEKIIAEEKLTTEPNTITARMDACREACFLVDASLNEIKKDFPKWDLVLSYLLRAQRLVMNEQYRPHERAAVKGIAAKKRGKVLGDENSKRAFKIERHELLKRCKDVYRMYGCNQEDLQEHIARKLPIGAVRVKQLMRKYKIYFSDYS